MKNLRFLFSVLTLVTLTQHSKATDVCASESLTRDNVPQLCPKDCKDAGATWGAAHDWSIIKSRDCTKEGQSKNTNGSVCGCTFTGCTDVTVTYISPKPVSTNREIVADSPKCPQTTHYEPTTFGKPSETISFTNSFPFKFREKDQWESQDTVIPYLNGKPVHIECTFDKYEYFKDCKIVK